MALFICQSSSADFSDSSGWIAQKQPAKEAVPQEHNPRYHTYTNFLHKSAFCNLTFRGKLNFTRSREPYQGVYGDRGDLRMIRLFLRFMYFCSNFHASYCFFIRSIISAISPVPLFLCHPYRTVLSRSVFVGCSESGSGHSSDIKVYVSIIRFARTNTQPAASTGL